MTDAERAYYDQRASEYDDWWLGTGLYAARVRRATFASDTVGDIQVWSVQVLGVALTDAVRIAATA